MRKKAILQYLLSLSLIFLPLLAFAESAMIGIYGVPAVRSEGSEILTTHLEKSRVSAVFVPPDKETIRLFKKQNIKVYLTLNVFGGRGAWKEFPDSVPVTADGKKISNKYGGVCPTHFEWRESRLQLLERWLKENSGEQGISGVWLDFIRYPGSWEHEKPSIPDSCYCQRCLTLFQVEKGVDVPDDLNVIKLSRWIKKYAADEWLQWKKEQITSFVRDVRTVMDKAGDKKVKLGVFLVPWMQGEKDGAVTFSLGQDAGHLAGYVDVFSPMVYHKMVARKSTWITELTEYFADLTGKPVWPIIQAEGLSPDEFENAVLAVEEGEGSGILVYSYPKMKKAFWPLLAEFSPSKNLLQDSNFQAVSVSSDNEKEKGPGAVNESESWQQGQGGQILDSSFYVWPEKSDRGKRSLGVAAGMDRQGSWWQTIPACTPGKNYLFSGDFFRHDVVDRVYPELEIWGRSYRLNSHRIAGKYQTLRRHITCPDEMDNDPKVFRLVNKYPGHAFWMQNPRLIETSPAVKQFYKPVNAKNGLFTIGAYGGNLDNLDEFKSFGFNSSVLGLSREAIDRCVKLGMHCTFSLPRDTEKIKMLLDKVGTLPESGHFAFYVNDEPGIHSFPRWKAKDINRLLKERYPNIPTMMAVVRPQVIADYDQAADYFMLDQYPVPWMPMTWLSDSMDQAAESVGRNRLHSVIQAFGGEKWQEYGWPKMPDFEEINCLAFLSLIHGSQGIYFFKYQEATATDQGREALKTVVSRLQKLQPWLESRNHFVLVDVEMTSINKLDPQGRPGVHCAGKRRGVNRIFVCANTLRTYTSARAVVGGTAPRVWQEFYSDEKLLSVDGSLELNFSPLEVKVFIAKGIAKVVQ